MPRGHRPGRYDDTVDDWELFDNNLPTVSVTDLEINTIDSKITAATYGRGIWQSNLPTESLLNEISIEEIQGVNQSVSCNSLDTTKILVKNLGTNPISSINIETNLNGDTNNTVITSYSIHYTKLYDLHFLLECVTFLQ